MSSRHLFSNGIDGETGRYLFPPTTESELAALARGEQPDLARLAELERWRESREYRRLRAGDPGDLAAAGWGIIFAADDARAPAIREAMSCLLAHRCAQATRVHGNYYRDYSGAEGYRRGESKMAFLTRQGVAPGAADPEHMPYYLLIVGDPETIPFGFQYQLDIEYAVGRICFDTVDEYAAYAASVVAAETGPPRPRRAVLFAPRHPQDPATDLSSGDLAKPLAERIARRNPGWEVATALGEAATKARLSALLGGGEPAALVFTAGHGVGYGAAHPLQRERQGALLCQDFPGFASWNGRVPSEQCFAAEDVGSDADLRGMVSFHFACYSAGTPAREDFPEHRTDPPASLAPAAFVSRLSQRLLGHPRGGALAVIGHVEKAWPQSIAWPGVNGRSIQAFEDAFDRLLDGYPVGFAMESFGERYAELAADLSAELEIERYGVAVDESILGRLFTGRNDSRNYAVVGDPAVRLGPQRSAADDDEEDDGDVLRGYAIS